MSPPIGIIQGHIKDAKALIARASINTLDGLETLVTDIRSETIALTNFKASWEAHLASTQSQ